MTWADAGLGLLAFVLAAVEASVSACYTRSVAAGNVRGAIVWGLIFEAVILLDVWFLIEARWLAIPILAGSGLGIWVALRKRP